MSSLPQLIYRMLPVQPVATPTAEGLLDAIYDAFQSTKYADQKPRTPGSGTAWLMSRYKNASVTEAIYGKAPEAAISTMDVILAGVDTGSPSPTMRTPDTLGTGAVYASVNKGGSGFTTWDGAAPFGAGKFFGYWRGINATSFGILVWVFESMEDFWVLSMSSTGSLAIIRIGAIIDPHTADASDAETSGRLFGMVTCGTGGTTANLWDSNGPFHHNAAANSHHFGVFIPGAATITTLRVNATQAPSAASATSINRGRLPFLQPVAIRDLVTPYAFIGELRDTFVFEGSKMSERVVDKATGNSFYLVSGYLGGITTALCAGIRAY